VGSFQFDCVDQAPLSAGDPFEYLKGSTVQIVPFRGVDNDIHQLYTINNNTQWVQTDASASAGAPTAASDAIGYVSGNQYMDYRGADNHIHQLFVPATQWVTADLTNLAGAPLATDISDSRPSQPIGSHTIGCLSLNDSPALLESIYRCSSL
jgi:hypothetical protein